MSSNPVSHDNLKSFLINQGWDIQPNSKHFSCKFKLEIDGNIHIEDITLNKHTKDKKNASFESLRDFAMFYGISKNELAKIINNKKTRKEILKRTDEAKINIEYERRRKK